jgi:hypothetical protein
MADATAAVLLRIGPRLGDARGDYLTLELGAGGHERPSFFSMERRVEMA